MVISATAPARTASTGMGPRRISTSTIGISTTAVAIRFSKGSIQRVEGTRNYNQAETRVVLLRGASPGLGDDKCVIRGSSFHRFDGVHIAVIQSPVSAFPLLILRERFKQMRAAEIRPQRRSDKDFGVSQLPQ